MTTQELANQLVTLCREGKYEQVYKELFSEDVWSIEPEGTPGGKVQGLAAIRKKGEEWNAMIETVHSSHISDPIVADNYFACAWSFKATMKGSSAPMEMQEICLYHVQDGKVVSEQFFYTPDPQYA